MRIVHFEIHASDISRAKLFYEEVFGWSFTHYAEVNYWVIKTGEDNSPGINGGMMERKGAPPEDNQPINGFTCIVEVNDIDSMITSVKERGGQVTVEKYLIDGVGWVAYFKDTEGNIFGMMQNLPIQNSQSE